MSRFRLLSASLLLLTTLSVAAAPSPAPAVAAKAPIQERADRFLALTNASYQALYRVNSEAQWKAVTDVTPEHDAASETAAKAYAAFNGNPALITEVRDLLKHSDELAPLTVRELRQALLNAGEGPMTNPTLTNNRIADETKQASILNSFQFKLHGKADHGEPDRRPAQHQHRSGGTKSGLGSVEGIGPGSADQSRPPAR